MPFTSPLLAVQGLSFDCLIETTGTYSLSSGSSNQHLSYSSNGTFNVVSDPKGIVIQTYESSTRDSVRLTTSGTLKMTLLTNYTYSPNNSNDRAGLTVVSLAPDGDYTWSSSGYQHPTFNGSSAVAVEDATIDNSAARPGLIFALNKFTAGGTFSTSGKLLIGINKT
jgi:hypothetical protein